MFIGVDGGSQDSRATERVSATSIQSDHNHHKPANLFALSTGPLLANVCSQDIREIRAIPKVMYDLLYNRIGYNHE
jgi:hypothetical protein